MLVVVVEVFEVLVVMVVVLVDVAVVVVVLVTVVAVVVVIEIVVEDVVVVVGYNPLEHTCLLSDVAPFPMCIGLIATHS